jgi:hypothetical protein
MLKDSEKTEDKTFKWKFGERRLCFIETVGKKSVIYYATRIVNVLEEQENRNEF